MKRNTIRATWLISRADAWVFDVTSYHIVAGPLLWRKPTLVNLWHGIGPKKEPPNDAPRWVRWITKRMFSQYDLVCTTAWEAVPHFFATPFNLDRNKVLPLGYPRHDFLFEAATDPHSTQKARAELGRVIGVSVTNRCVLVAPTWDASGLGEVDWSTLTSTARKHGATVFYRPHPLAALQWPAEVCQLPASVVPDITRYLPAFDALVTDYSSIAYDFAILKRPILFYLHHYADMQRSRGLNFRVPEDYPGIVALSNTDFVTGLETLFRESDTLWQEKCDAVLDRFWLYRDGKAALRISKWIEDRLRLR